MTPVQAALFIWATNLWDALLEMWWDSEILFFICIYQHKVQPVSRDNVITKQGQRELLLCPGFVWWLRTETLLNAAGFSEILL